MRRITRWLFAGMLVLAACESSDPGTDGGRNRDGGLGADGRAPTPDGFVPRDSGLPDATTLFDAGPATIVPAASCAQGDVEAAITNAERGDVVQVPAGTCIWSDMTIDAPIYLRGAGVDQTVITTSNVEVRKHAEGIVRISRFTFERAGGGNASKAFYVRGSWRNAQPAVFQDNKFTVRGSGFFLVDVAGGVIIARNEFNGEWDDSFLQLKNTGDADGSWSSADTLGTRDVDGQLNHYIENNTFTGGTNQGIDADDATRVVYRHNRLVHSSFNTHGLATSPDGVRHFEVYSNEFIHEGDSSPIANQNWSIWIRGGTGVIFDNQLADIAGSHWGDKPEFLFTIRGAEDARPQGACGDVQYPVPRQLGQGHDGTNPVRDPIYIWGNMGAQAVAATWNWGNPCGLNFADYFQWGRDAFNDGTTRPGYAPFPYPHPQVLSGP